MSQCVPSWDVDENPTNSRVLPRSNSNSTAPDVPMFDYEVGELTWENGQPSMHGLGLPRVPAKPLSAAAGIPSSKYTWEKPRAGGTLESIVNEATRLPHRSKSMFDGAVGGGRKELVPWFDPHSAVAAAATTASNTLTMDALVPCSNRADDKSNRVLESTPRGLGTSRAASCSGPATQDDDCILVAKSATAAHVPTQCDLSSRDQNQSVSGSATFGRDSQQTCDREVGLCFTSTSMGSLENTSSFKQCTMTTTADDHDSVCHRRPQREEGEEEDKKKQRTGKCSVSTKRGRAAAIHNQSERKRRDKINERMETLQKLVPNSSKTDKASMLDEVIEYLKQLQAQVQMMSRMKMSSMMVPMTMQQQLQMSMMAPMGIGMGMGINTGMGMDMNTMSCPNIPGIPPFLHPSAFMPMASWDASGVGDRLQGPPPMGLPYPMSTFLACQSQPMTMDAYSRMAAMYHQMLHQPPGPASSLSKS